MSEEIRQLCSQYTTLGKEDIDEIVNIARYLDHFCELADADLFIDCFVPGNSRGIVVAHGKPSRNSQYRRNIQGDMVLPENEPIVFYTMKTGRPIRDAKGLSQEGKWVLQRTLPIRRNDTIIGVLIEESDITDSVKEKRKLKQITGKDVSKPWPETESPEQDDAGMSWTAVTREMHHRIKNSLQIISSILSMQERRSQNEETKIILRDNINRISNIARTHEILMDAEDIDLKKQITILAENMMNYANGEGKNIRINVEGDKIKIEPAKLLSILMVTNELLTNSIRHGYPDKTNGTIEINLIKGTAYSTVIIGDDGIGIERARKCSTQKRKGLGTDLVNMLITDDLKGQLNVDSDEAGTYVYFDFSMT